MKKTLATLAIAALALTGCATTNNNPEPAETTASATTEQTIAPANAPSESPQAQAQSPVEQEIGYKGYIAHVDQNGDVTWTDLNGNTIPSVDWEIAGNYPYTQAELERIQKGFEDLAQEAEAEADALVEAEFGQSTPEATFDPSDTAIPGDAEYYADKAPAEDDMRSYCENLDQATASSGELQMCFTEYGL